MHPCRPGTWDSDGDGICNADDICDTGPDWLDADGDGIPDACDACPSEYAEIDLDHDGCPDEVTVSCYDETYDDVDHDGVPDRCDPCLPPGCPALWEVFNGDFEDGLTGWSPANYAAASEVSVVRDATGMVLRLTLGGCGFVEVTGTIALPYTVSEEVPSLRLRYWLDVQPPEVPSRVTASLGNSVWHLYGPSEGWQEETLCLVPTPGDYRGRIVLGITWCPECDGCSTVAMLDDLQVVWDATQCLAPD